MWLVRRTRAILRRAEFGFFGVIVRTIVQTPRFWGAPRRSSTRRPFLEFQVVRSAGVSTFLPCGLRPLRTSCEIVGTTTPCVLVTRRAHRHARTSTQACCLGSLPDRRARPAWARSPGAARPQSQDRDRADARNDRPEGRSPSRKTGRIRSLGVYRTSGQPVGTFPESPAEGFRRSVVSISAFRTDDGRACPGVPSARWLASHVAGR